MKRLLITMAILAVTVVATQAVAHEENKDAKQKSKTAAAAKEEATPVTGEVVDMGCYLGHGARGEKHIGCATKCILGGMPMGVLTSDGALYLLTMNHDNPDPYNKLKNMAGKIVTVSGEHMERNGMKGIDVVAFKAASKATAD